MRYFIVISLFGLILMTGCATGAINRTYRINATGYAEVEGKNVKEAAKEALSNARRNLITNVGNFFEYKFNIDPQIEQEILYLSKIGEHGVEKGFCYVNVYCDLDLYKFIAKHGDLRNIYSWELLGLESVYSEYVTSNKPIGIWAKDYMIKSTLKDPFLMSYASIIPCFSGNFLINKPVMGSFFTATKSIAICAALLSESKETEIKMWSWIGLGIMTGLDILSVFTETSAINSRLQLFQNAILMGKSDLSFSLFAKKF
ncbi:MAG: hypothetical protein N2114_03925 [Candidatus Goldbacteria bacterium]|nr:hypothetical protein [Candidatus Goldiibacteriota bacterium]